MKSHAHNITSNNTFANSCTENIYYYCPAKQMVAKFSKKELSNFSIFISIFKIKDFITLLFELLIYNLIQLVVIRKCRYISKF